jgi:hypothetical protein
LWLWRSSRWCLSGWCFIFCEMPGEIVTVSGSGDHHREPHTGKGARS